MNLTRTTFIVIGTVALNAATFCRAYPLANGTAGGVAENTVHWGVNGLTVVAPDGRTIYSEEKNLRKDLSNWSAKGPDCTFSREITPLSMVGNVLSIKQIDYDNGGACGILIRPNLSISFRATDLNTGNNLRLTDIFSESAVLQSLLKDSVVRQALDSAGVKAAPRSLSELWVATANADLPCGYSINEEILDQFALHHVEGNRIAVRLAMPSSCVATNVKPSAYPVQIGLLIPIPANLSEAVRAADSTSRGFLMENKAARSKWKNIHLLYRK